MYIPEHFQETDPDTIEDFITEHTFALLVSQTEAGPLATHLPLLLRKEGDQRFLHGHLAKANPQAETLSQPGPKLAVFSGPDAYISSSWYRQGRIPTWNYMTVHVRGEMRTMNRQELRHHLRQLMERQEGLATPRPMRFEDVPKEELAENIPDVVGFEMAVTSVEAAFKLSQNKSREDRERVISELMRKEDDSALGIARAMQERLDDEPK